MISVPERGLLLIPDAPVSTTSQEGHTSDCSLFVRDPEMIAVRDVAFAWIYVLLSIILAMPDDITSASAGLSPILGKRDLSFAHPIWTNLHSYI